MAFLNYLRSSCLICVHPRLIRLVAFGAVQKPERACDVIGAAGGQFVPPRESVGVLRRDLGQRLGDGVARRRDSQRRLLDGRLRRHLLLLDRGSRSRGGSAGRGFSHHILPTFVSSYSRLSAWACPECSEHPASLLTSPPAPLQSNWRGEPGRARTYRRRRRRPLL